MFVPSMTSSFQVLVKCPVLYIGLSGDGTLT